MEGTSEVGKQRGGFKKERKSKEFAMDEPLLGQHGLHPAARVAADLGLSRNRAFHLHKQVYTPPNTPARRA